MLVAGTGAAHQRTAAELKRLIEHDRTGVPYLVLRDGHGLQRELVLDAKSGLTVGRDEECGLALSWDATVSRLHAELECRAGSWTITDDGLSKNGTFVNGERIVGRRRLHDRDVIRVGSTSIDYRNRAAAGRRMTVAVTGQLTAADVSPMQRKVLVALCRPFASGSPHATPATNRTIAAELVLSEDAVKSHMRALFTRFEVGALPQNVKRARVVEIALASGIVTPRDIGAS